MDNHTHSHSLGRNNVGNPSITPNLFFGKNLPNYQPLLLDAQHKLDEPESNRAAAPAASQAPAAGEGTSPVNALYLPSIGNWIPSYFQRDSGSSQAEAEQ